MKTNRLPHAAPHWTVVARRQHALLWRSRRVPLLLLAVIAILAGSLNDAIDESRERESALRNERITEARREQIAAMPAVPVLERTVNLASFIGIGWAFAVWWGETRDRRRYHQAMPVRRSTHDLWRIGAGATWLSVATAFLVIGGLIVDSLYQKPAWSSYPAVFWINIFTVPLIAYLGISVLQLLTKHPFAATVGVAVFVGILVSVAQTLRITPVETTAMAVLDGRYGLFTATEGGVRIVQTDRIRAALANPSFRLDTPTSREFVIATTGWMLLAITAVGAAAHRKPES
jgi:hypothetical protein